MDKVLYEKTSGINFKDKIGYALGDTACCLVFGLVGSFLLKYYTDILLIPAQYITVLFIVARIWDAINDIIWGRFIDSRKSSRYGKYRQWLLYIPIPLALSTIFMFVKIPGLTQTQYIIYMYITYILFGMLYTAVNIPYGSLASVITTDETERSSLSIFRSIGSGLGGLPASIILPLFCFTTIIINGEEVEKLSYKRLLFGVIILAIISVLMFFISFKWSKERVVCKDIDIHKPKKHESLKVIIQLFKNKPLIVISIVSLLSISAQLFTQSYNLYLFSDYFSNASLYSISVVITYLPMVILIFFMNKIITKFGKKEICAWGMLFSGIISIILFLVQTTNPYIFLIFYFFNGIGFAFLLLEIWALVTDVIDYQEYLTGRRDEGTVYSFFSFTRKLGHTLAGVLSTKALVWIGYDANISNFQTYAKMYDCAVLIPAALYILMFLFLHFLYPLNKKKLNEMNKKIG